MWTRSAGALDCSRSSRWEGMNSSVYKPEGRPWDGGELWKG